MHWRCASVVLQTVKEFIEKVKAAGNKDVTLYMYAGEGHGFMNGGEDIHKKMKSKVLQKLLKVAARVPYKCLCCAVSHT